MIIDWFYVLQAEEITLTIGQAFELAYKKFLESKGKDLEKEKQSMVMHKRIELLENENKELKKRLTDIANIKGDNDVKQYMRENNVSAFTVDTVQDFLIKLDMKPCMHLVEISIFSINHVIVRLTNIMNNLLEHLKICTFKVIFLC